MVHVVLLVKLAPRVIPVKLAEWAPWAELALRETQAPPGLKARMDSKGLSARKAREETRVPEEIQVPRAPLVPEAQQALVATAPTRATLEERAPMVLPGVAATRDQEATQENPALLVPPEKRDHAVQQAPLGLKVIRAPQAPLVTKALRDNAVKPATLARMVFPASPAERARRDHAATLVIRAMRVPRAEPDKRDVKADRETEATQVLRESREQMAPSAPEARVLPKETLETPVILVRLDS